MDKKAKNTVKVHFDPSNPPQMTDEQIARLQSLSQMPDDEIDYSDSPSAENLNWQRPAAISQTGALHKSTVSVQIDDDILQYFQRFGESWQNNINNVLRSYIQNL